MKDNQIHMERQNIKYWKVKKVKYITIPIVGDENQIHHLSVAIVASYY
jgi:hypothetical protein